MFWPNSCHCQVYNLSAVRVLQYASLRQGVDCMYMCISLIHVQLWVCEDCKLVHLSNAITRHADTTMNVVLF
jgi:Zn-finger protein